MISIVAALDSKRGIGKGNDLLFHIPEDFVRMKKLTMGHPLIMGRKTFESIGRVLPGRTNIVVSRSPVTPALLDNQDVIVCSSLEEAIAEAKEAPGNEEIVIFGGGQIFKEAIEKDLVDVLHLTIVEGDFGADTFFPEYSSKFKLETQEEHQDANYKYNFQTLKRN